MRAPARAVADRRANLRLRVADDDADVADAGGDERLEPVEEHRLVGDRDQLLGARVGDGTEARALAAAQNQAFHRLPILSVPVPRCRVRPGRLSTAIRLRGGGGSTHR